MIFLGAGASKELGVPTLQSLSEVIFSELKRSAQGNLIDRIENSLKGFNIKPDFESVYSILEALQNPYESIKKAGPFTAFLLKNIKNLPLKIETQELLETSRKKLYNLCTITKEKTNKILEVYDPLFNTIKHHKINDIFTFNGVQHNMPLNAVIATTNYDMALELYFMKKEIAYIDGYEQRTYNANIKDFKWELLYDPYRYGEANAQKQLLIKLHGSIWQFNNNGNLLKTNNYPDNLPINIDIGKEMMIYPTREKEILSWNYYHFFNLFKKIEWEKLLVIGYSFRDEPINMTIIENMQNNKNAKLWIFNPHLKEVLQNLNGLIDNDRIFEIPQYFGTSSGKKAIEDLVQYGLK